MRILIGLSLLCMAAIAPAEVYKWQEQEGTVYSDRPVEGAEKVEQLKLQTYKAPSQPAPRGAPAGEAAGEKEDEAPAPAYAKIRIVNPENDEAIRDDGGRVTIHLSIVPALAEGDSVSILMDGEEVIAGQKTSRFQLTNVDRGTHSLQAVIKGPEAETRISSDAVTFHMQRTSVQQNNPNTAFPRASRLTLPGAGPNPFNPYAD